MKLFELALEAKDNVLSTLRLRHQIFVKKDLEDLVTSTLEQGKNIAAYNSKTRAIEAMTEEEALSLRHERSYTFAVVGIAQVPEGKEDTGEVNYFMTILEA